MSDHKIVHIEFAGANPAALSKFYADAFGWKISSFPEFDYYTFNTGGDAGGGFPTLGGQLDFKLNEPLVYIDTDDIDASLAKIKSLGGEALSPATEVPGQGWFATFRDVAGNRLALWKTTTPAA
jgi:predicted enzyme related to lactoylglutathione lyase